MTLFSIDKNIICIFNRKMYLGSFKRWNFWANKAFRTATYILLLDLSFVFLFPFLYMIVNSFKSMDDLRNIVIKWVPSEIVWKNYITAYLALNYHKHLFNSLFVTSLATIGHIFTCSFTAYGFARYRFPGKNLFFAVVIISFITPIQVLIAPMYLNYFRMGFLRSYLPLIVPTFLGYGLRGGLFIFIFRQFFIGLPYEYEEAARIDGCGFLKTYFRIMLPTSKSSILVCAVLSVIWHWNDYFEPILYLQKTSLQLLSQRLPAMYEALNAIEKIPGKIPPFNEAVVMAGTFLVVLPLLIIYLFIQKEFAEGIEHTGHTG